MMKRHALWVGLLVLMAAPAFAQTITTPASKLQWDQPATSLAAAQGATYTTYADGGAEGTVLPGVTCAPLAVEFRCTAPFPPFTPGTHQMTLTARDRVWETAKSDPITFTFVVVLGVPMNLQIVGAP